MVLHPTEPRVIAVLDWELSTLGDPLADFTYYLMNWVMPHDGRSGLGGVDLDSRSASRRSKNPCKLYCELTGRDGIACSSTGISPTTPSASPASCKASSAACVTARPPARTPRK